MPVSGYSVMRVELSFTVSISFKHWNTRHHHHTDLISIVASEEFDFSFNSSVTQSVGEDSDTITPGISVKLTAHTSHSFHTDQSSSELITPSAGEPSLSL